MLSGSVEHLDQLIAALPDGTQAQWLHASHAFHSPLMPLPAHGTDARRIPGHSGEAAIPPAARPVTSTVTGQPGDELRAPEYWVEHVRNPVRSADAITTTATTHGTVHFAEVGPDSTLTAPIRSVLDNPAATSFLRRDGNEPAAVRRAAGSYTGTLDIAPDVPLPELPPAELSNSDRHGHIPLRENGIHVRRVVSLRAVGLVDDEQLL